MSGETITTMPKVDLSSVGITHWTQLYRNPSYEELYQHELDPSLEGLERGTPTKFGAVAVDTGRFTGRSPQDKYVVEDDTTRAKVWWVSPENPGSNNRRMSQATWDHVKELAVNQLNGKKLYVIDGYCGANPDTRISVRIITEVAWQAHFCKNMFLRPDEHELDTFKPDWTILNASKISCPDPAKWGLRTEVFAAFNIKEHMTVIGGTWYGGEMKKGIFTIMNYFLPLRGIGAFHCSANMGKDGDTALFFGLSGTGKTTLSADPHRLLIGDDEHGWDNDGVFNFEGGCYAKTINLKESSEPDIYHAIKRDALLENVRILADGSVDFADTSKTENGRVSYPIHHIENIVKPVSKGGHPDKIIFLAADAFGVLPPVAKLSPDQAMYQYLSGYTAKVAGTELGVTEPKATFSTCYGAAFLALHPTVYATILGKKMHDHNAEAYLVNTGWTAGVYGIGHRMGLVDTRHIIDAILDGTLSRAEYVDMLIFGFHVPKFVHDVDSHILNPRETWHDRSAYDATARKLAQMFIDNFKRFEDTPEGKRLAEVAGPSV